MAIQIKPLADIVDAGETLWVTVDMRAFERMHLLSEAIEEGLESQVSGLVYVCAETDGRISIGGDEVEMVLEDGGDGVYGELVQSRGDGMPGRVSVALDFGLSEVRAMVD